jgi:amino acid adenylation domain-containing protein
VTDFSLTDYLTRSAGRAPDKTAVVMGEQRLSYGQLESESNRLARFLADAGGVARGDRVVLLLPKSPAAIVAMLATLKTGAAYVPVDVESPSSRVARILKIAEPTAVLACADSSALANELDAEDALSGALCVRDLDALAASGFDGADSGPINSQASPEDLAYLMFTSGSTGLPKGVMITHANVMHFIEWATTYFDMTDTDRISGHPPLHFDLSTFDIFGTLSVGAELYLVPSHANSNPRELASFISEHRLTQWFSVPSALTYMTKYGAVGEGDFPELKRLLWCGEPLPTPTLIEWMTRLPHVEFTNLYGPTETTIASSYFTVPACPTDATTPIPIGIGCAGEELVVLDEDLNPVQTGTIAEIYIAGVGLGPGYWRDGEKTAAAFRPHPTDPEVLLYRTGDLGRVEPDGLTYILGRVDSQIKSRGYRIELGEIETALNTLESLKESAVVAVELGEFGGPTICCVYAPRDGEQITDGQVRAALAEQVPPYMLPLRWLALDELPKNLNGKIDRPHLRAQFEAQAEAAADASDSASREATPPAEPSAAADFTASLLEPARPGPTTSQPGDTPADSRLAHRLAAVPRQEWQHAAVSIAREELCALLGIDAPDEVPSDRAFSELGLDSAGAIELGNRLDHLTGLDLDASLVFDHPTLESVAAHLIERVQGTCPSAPSVTTMAPASDEPIAIVGMGCRYPGDVDSPQALWDVVADGRDAISSFPTDRGWKLDELFDPDPAHTGTSYTTHGGFIADAPAFDAAFFEISPREALAMEPQQRLLLEVAWEALEDAGIDPTTLRGTATGVFAGVIADRYGSSSAPAELEGLRLTGAATSVTSGRLGYTLGLEGPAISFDTACSSSLVALHHAAHALRRGECSLALASGVTIMSSPRVFVEFSRQRGLAPDGRCKPFSDDADGTGWSEGAGVLVLERLSDAERHGHHVCAVLRGSATNGDGASNGLTAPSGPAQERVIRQALADASLTPADVDVIEAHGTGTTLGDPIEAHALLSTYGAERDTAPVHVGSIKSNIGHTAAAAGIAGVIKMVQAMAHERLPATLHVKQPSSRIDWSKGNVSLLLEPVSWPAGGRPRRAAISSFGISGTNAHVIIEEPPAAIAAPPTEDPALCDRTAPWALSAKTPTALRIHAERLHAFVSARPDLSPADIGRTLSARAGLSHRAVVVGRSRDSLLAGLEAVAHGRRAGSVTVGSAARGRHRMAFLFTGQGAQRRGMGRELYAASAPFRQSLDQTCARLGTYLKQPLLPLLLAEESGDPSPLDHTELAQAGLFALEVALFELLQTWGLRPDFVMGHSIGELSAAHAAGVLSHEDACSLVGARAQLMGALPQGGAMVAIEASEAEILRALTESEGKATLAGVNGPRSVVISGDEQPVLEIAERWERDHGRRTKRLRVSHAFHSPHMDPMLEEFGALAAQLTYAEAQIPIVSNLTGEILPAELIASADYWIQHTREPVQFAAGIDGLHSTGVRTFIELGPDGVLSALARDHLDDRPEDEDEAPITAVPVLRATHPEPDTVLAAAAAAWANGHSVDWGAVFAGTQTSPVRLPTYPFERRPYWLAPADDAGDEPRLGRGSARNHPLLDGAVELADEGGEVLVGHLSLASHPWLSEHLVMDRVLVPGTTWVDLALHAGRSVGSESLEELVMEAPLVLLPDTEVQLQVRLSDADPRERRTISIFSRPTPSRENGRPGAWTRHAKGLLARAQAASGDDVTGEPAARHQRDPWPQEDWQEIDLDRLYRQIAELGVDYGPAFMAVRRAWRHGDKVYSELEIPEDQQPNAQRFDLHPVLLDAALHASFALREELKEMVIPFAWSWVAIRRTGQGRLRVHARVAPTADHSVLITDPAGEVVAEFVTLARRRILREHVDSAQAASAEPLLSVHWTALSDQPPAAPAAAPPVLLAEADSDLTRLATGATGQLEHSYPSLDALRAALDADGAPPSVVLFDCASSGAPAAAQDADTPRADSPAAIDMPAAVRALTSQALSLVQEWLADTRFAASTLVLVTERAVAADADDEVPGLMQAGVWGLVRTAQSENPRRFGLIDHDGSEASILAVPGALKAVIAADEPQVALRAGQILVPRLTPIGAAATGSGRAAGRRPAKPPRFEAESTVLITGGTGGVGALVARHLVEHHGARHLILASRSGPHAPGAERLQGALSDLGATVTVCRCDVTDRESLRELIGAIGVEPPLTAVVHAAGTLADGVLSALSAERLSSVLAPKVAGAWNLHQLTQDLDLSAFILFSSVTGVTGGAGQANYAAANTFLDALASHRHGRGLPATALAWGPWREAGGMTAHLSPGDYARLARFGIEPLGNLESLRRFDEACSRSEALIVPIRVHRAGMREPGAAPAVMFRALARPAHRTPRPAVNDTFTAQFTHATGNERRRVVLEAVRAEAAIALGHDSRAAVDARQPFREAGLDSLAAVELRNGLVNTTGLRLAPTVTFDHPTPAALTDHLLEQLSAGDTNGQQPAGEHGAEQSDVDHDADLSGASSERLVQVLAEELD